VPTLTFELHVHPGSSRRSVGGNHNGALIIHVRSRAVDGAANAEVLRVLADAFSVKSRNVSLIRGATSRQKLVSVSSDDPEITQRLDDLLTAESKRQAG
jgi:uncharacterized protein